ncbi:MAG: PAS domain-containing protein [Caenispirillum bisanense]|nr:PAS domain-containing protein [Caenispirillum bisanense]MCA1974722.1 PAS domain-containing protein [Caenispirillum sp.]
MHFAPDIDQPRLKTLFRYWVEKRGAVVMPSPGSVDLAELPAEVRRHCVLYRVEKNQPDTPSGLRFRVAAAGDEVIDRYGPAIEGRAVDEILHGHHADVVIRTLESVVRDRVVHFYRTVVALAGGGAVLHTKLLLPLGIADTEVTAILGGLCRGEPPAEGTLENNYHSRFAALDVIEDRPEDFR